MLEIVIIFVVVNVAMKSLLRHPIYATETQDLVDAIKKQRTSEATFKSLVGQRFGKLVVVERVANNRFDHVCYRCKCDCGGGTIVDSTNLKKTAIQLLVGVSNQKVK